MSTEQAGTDELRSWDELSNQQWPTLLLGNGLSINIWRKFAYSELLREAELEEAASQLFSDLHTVNFETVLEGLWHAERVLEALHRPADEVQEVKMLYEHVRTELVAAVQKVHIPWDRIPAQTLRQIASALDSHNLVFTLNYDLLIYWAVMNNVISTNIGDYFWAYPGPFNPYNTELFTGRTGLLYLHGGVHLWQDSLTGETGKWTVTNYGGLLVGLADQFSANPDRQPLFVSEGTSAQKMRVIRRSEYLSFAREQLFNDSNNTVIFGASFGDQDDHIVEALRAGGRRRVAISIRSGSPDQNKAAAAYYTMKLPGHELVFFDSRTHPLGDPMLAVEPT